MQYAIETLEIEIARLKKGLREFHSSSFKYEDMQDGHLADSRGMENHIYQLEQVIKILNEWAEEHPVEVERYRLN